MRINPNRGAVVRTVCLAVPHLWRVFHFVAPKILIIFPIFVFRPSIVLVGGIHRPGRPSQGLRPLDMGGMGRAGTQIRRGLPSSQVGLCISQWP